MYTGKDLEHFRLIMGIASLLDLCHNEKMYGKYSVKAVLCA